MLQKFSPIAVAGRMPDLERNLFALLLLLSSSSFFFFSFLLPLLVLPKLSGTSTGTCKFKSLGKCCRSRNFPKCASEGGRRKFFGFKCQEQLQVGGRQEVLRTGAGHDVFASWVAEPFKDS